MNAWMLSVTSFVGSGTATAQDAAETKDSSTAGSRLRLLRIHPPRSGERFGGEVRLFCTVLSTPRPLLVEKFLEHFPAGSGDPHGSGDVLAQVGVDEADRMVARGQHQRLVQRGYADFLPVHLDLCPRADEEDQLAFLHRRRRRRRWNGAPRFMHRRLSGS